MFYNFLWNVNKKKLYSLIIYSRMWPWLIDALVALPYYNYNYNVRVQVQHHFFFHNNYYFFLVFVIYLNFFKRCIARDYVAQSYIVFIITVSLVFLFSSYFKQTPPPKQPPPQKSSYNSWNYYNIYSYFYF